MRALTIGALITMLVSPATHAAAQGRPVFAGRWTSDPDPATSAPASAASAPGAARPRSPGSMGSGWGSTIAITQDTARLTVEYAFFTRGDMQAPLRFIYALDGAPTKNSVMMGHGIQAHVSRAAWEGEKLALVTTSAIPHPAGTGAPLLTEIRQVLSLESPTSLVVETTRAGVLGGSTSTTRTLYRKL